MKTILKKVSLLLMAVSFSGALSAQAIAKNKANIDTEKFRYEIECVSVGASGSYLVKVWSYSKKPNVAIEQAKKNAVHGVIFKGFTGAGAGCTQKPLASSPSIEEEKEEYFNNFFADGGKYMKFVSVSGDGSVAAEDRLKVGKEYKIGVVISVSKDNLRKDLEDAGIVKGLSSGF